ncbi:recombinase RdgC [Rugosibacter aromaticivorans]|uniref:Recombination-associated protein RdgC n=1 Tax=Rugosibacter aromaticivorans TaxID=1565605 RepID=A0A0C5JB01_9PROT|nr:recombination-associated protein RdgC [Rugosibacter aromaticivorans]AJP48983.1 recombinase RdgC [Rugosibacter aromaticivorans]TBR12917.1 MAG: recombination-associated protein RdgC [Rugosibacter sp.]
MWFRNLQIFRLADAWQYSSADLATALTRGLFVGCGATDQIARGWVPPRGEEGELVFTQQKQQLIALGVEQKLLPAAVVRQYAQAKLVDIEAAQGYKPGRKQVREVIEQMTLELLPRAFAKRGLTYLWIDPVNRWLVVDAASSQRADEAIEQLKLSLGDLPLSLLKTKLAPATAMTQWLAEGAAPGSFSIDRDCELRAAAEERAAVRYVRHNLDSDDVRNHIVAGKTVTRMSLTWQDRVSFTLTEQLQIKRLAFLDILKEDAERQAENADDLFAANFSLMCGNLEQLLAHLTKALGGESE